MSEHSLELPLQDNSNEYKKHTILDKNEEIHRKNVSNTWNYQELCRSMQLIKMTLGKILK